MSTDIPLDNRQAERASVVDALVPLVGDGAWLAFLYDVDKLSHEFHDLCVCYYSWDLVVDRRMEGLVGWCFQLTRSSFSGRGYKKAIAVYGYVIVDRGVSMRGWRRTADGMGASSTDIDLVPGLRK